jgi:hypothetical protein
MSDEQTPAEKPLEPNPKEENLLRSLRKNPMLAGQIQEIVSRFEQEVADGMNAEEAEASLINSLQALGVTMMTQWAHNTQQTTLEQALHHDATLNKHSKKNSSGIPPSAP